MAVQHKTEAAQAEPQTYTLTPIITDGPDALDTPADATIRDAILRKIEYALNDKFHQTATREADNLFACAPRHQAHPRLLPPGAIPTAATLRCHVANLPGTATVNIRPPHKVEVTPKSHAAAILAWLSKTSLNAARKLRQLAPLFLLALGSLLSPALDDLDDDHDDDGDDNHATLHQHS